MVIVVQNLKQMRELSCRSLQFLSIYLSGEITALENAKNSYRSHGPLTVFKSESAKNDNSTLHR